MAALIRHGLFKTGPKTVSLSCYATKAEKKKGIDRKVGPKIDSSAASLAAKGFLRPQNSYAPPDGLENKLKLIFERVLGTAEPDLQLGDLNKRFALFNECYKEFQHSVPNSLLHTIETTQDLLQFYSTPVNTITPLEKMKTLDLPPNLHIQHEYHRFHPDTDTKFGGVTAFPESSTVVTGLKYKDKYKGHSQKPKWPFPE